MKKAITIAALLVLVTWLSPSSAGPAGLDPPHAFTLPFSLVDNRVFIDVYLNDQGPFHFIFDTGAEAVVADGVARRIGLDVRDAGEGQGVGAARQHFGETKVAHVRVGKLLLDDVEASVTSFDDSPQVFGKQRVDGIIGSVVFERMVVKHDYVHRTLTFTPSETYRYSGAGTILPIRRPHQIPVIDASLDGVAGSFGVDTGARSALLLYGPYCEHNGLAEKYGAKLQGVTGWGIGGPVRSLLARAHQLDMGSASVSDIIVRLSTQKTGLTTSSEMAGLIGPDVLAQFDVTFDYARQRIILEKNENYGRHDSYDRAGVWMGQEGGRFAVVDVIAGGPGDEAGVRVGDKILAIDGKSTDKLDLSQVREQMRRRPVGEKVSLRLQSQGKERTVVVTLRELA